METIELTLAERGQIVIPKEARDALGLKPGARLQLRIEDGRLLIEKKVQLDLSKWVGHAAADGLSTNQALAELRGRPVPWQADDAKTTVAKTKLAKSGTAGTSKARPAPK
jgi:AbrB family looped-hinge helix DNA binding protein